MFFFYKNYPYAPRATLISVLGSMGALLSAVAAVLLFSCYSKNIIFIPLGILCAAAAVCSYIFLYMKLAQKIAEKDGEKNIRTRAEYGCLYCKEHPEMYDAIVSENAAFAAKYVRDENGKIITRKKYEKSIKDKNQTS